ncbi:MAG: hypothetical protein BM485_14620 [Desulfobulbaceae bacterium DB1]|nr:MAG: hypothetical protein BM485_14620 [Desulfobulbaceae bacterium DB1]
MPVTIRNIMERPVMLRLNSGLTCYLAPGATSAEIIDTEVVHNEKLLRMAMRGIITLIDGTKQVKTAPSRQTKNKSQKTKKANP